MIRHALAAAAFSFGLFASAANAEWHIAETKHFIIYADQNPTVLGEFANRLEKFDKAVRHVRDMDDPAIGDGNRLQVFVTRDENSLRKLANDRSGFVKGFYVGRASGSVAFVPRMASAGSEWEINAENVFFHEYAHHLMLQELDRPYPEWLVEGFAEFMSTARFEKNGSVGLGAPPMHRAYGLTQLAAMPLELMLGGAYERINDDHRESVYGRGWLLAHFLTFESRRRGQLAAYVMGIARGVPPLQSARASFGDLKQLDRELQNYLKRRSFTYLTVSPTVLGTPLPQVRRLSAGGAAVMPLRMESKRGVNKQTAETLAVKVRKTAAKHPGDPLVEVSLAEAEFDAGHFDAAEVAADRALKVDPRNVEAMIYKGRSIVERAAKAEGNRKPSFERARALFIAANKIDPEDPEPLMNFHETYWREGVRPTRNAVAALHYASNLAPQDFGLRLTSARQYLEDGKLPEARRTLVPIAFNPHGGKLAEVARKVIARVDAGDKAGAEKAAEAETAE